MAAMRYSAAGASGVLSAKYEQFKGADFTTDPSQVDANRSPWPVNLISDAGGFPEKRAGWRTLKRLNGRANGLFRLAAQGETHLLAHVGQSLWRWDLETPTLLYSGLNDERSQGFVQGERLYLLTGNAYLTYGADESGGTAVYGVRPVQEAAYLPTTCISRDPAGGGVQYEAVNLLNPKRKNSFLANGADKVYQLDAAPVDAVTEVQVNGAAMSSGYTVNLQNGTVTFSTAPKKPEDAGGVAGADNVLITYSRTVEGYAERITHCRVCTQYGQGSTDRVFFSGNPQYPNRDWCSGYHDPSYLPDTGYALIGSEETAVMGYLHLGEHLAVVKEDNQQDATIFLRGVSIDSEGEVSFPIKQGVQSVGAVSRWCFASLRDDPLFLSRYGVNAVVTSNVTLERSVRRRSGLIDPRLTQEPDMQEAVACVWNDWYVVCLNNRCYVADSKQQSYKSSLADHFMYEWYYWENVPARVLMEYGGALYFGTADGRICRFNNDIESMARFADDGAAIAAQWATKADDDGDFMRYKTMQRGGSGVMCKPYTSSSVQVALRTEKDFGRPVRRATMSVFDWENIDFENLSFNTLDTPQVMAFRKRQRRYKTLQILVKNEGVNQGFGIYGIIKRYRRAGYVK